MLMNWAPLARALSRWVMSPARAWRYPRRPGYEPGSPRGRDAGFGQNFASSAESVGAFWLGKLTKIV